MFYSNEIREIPVACERKAKKQCFRFNNMCIFIPKDSMWIPGRASAVEIHNLETDGMETKSKKKTRCDNKLKL